MNIYEFVQDCMEQGMTADEAEREWNEAVAERHERFMEDYYNDPLTQAGWAQQDLIDTYRRER